jgi:predicted Rossmann-fold nucleotide-binding protein
LGWHPKPVGLLDVAGYYAYLHAFLDHAQSEGFIKPQHRSLVLVEQTPTNMLARLKNFRPAAETKWIR